MYLKYLNRNNLILDRDGDRSIQQINSESTTDKLETEQINIVSNQGKTFVLSIFLLIFAAVFILKAGLQRRTKHSSKKLEYNSKIACRKCYFYNKNYHLRCAVHPDRVLTDKAEDCRDYQPRK